MKLSRLFFSVMKNGHQWTNSILSKPVHSCYMYPKASEISNLILNSKLTNHNKLRIELPTNNHSRSYIEVFDRVPLLDMNLPCLGNDISVTLPNPSICIEIMEPSTNSSEMSCKGGLLRIRRRKMNKHKCKKRKKRDRAKTRKLLIGRERVRRRKRANKKIILQRKVNRILERNPKSEYPNRPYVQHRLTNW